VAMANATRFGLAAVVVHRGSGAGGAGECALVAGTVWVNCFSCRDLRAAVRRVTRIRDRARRHLEFRFLLRRQEHGHRAEGWAARG